MLETKKYLRKPFSVDAVRVTADNLEEVAKWVNGEVRTDDVGRYVKVRVLRPMGDRQTKAYVGDWVLYAGTGYKVYTAKAFASSFSLEDDQSGEVVTGGEIISVVENPETTEANKPVAKKEKKSA